MKELIFKKSGGLQLTTLLKAKLLTIITNHFGLSKNNLHPVSQGWSGVGGGRATQLKSFCRIPTFADYFCYFVEHLGEVAFGNMEI